MTGTGDSRRAEFDAGMTAVNRSRAAGDLVGLTAALRSPVGNDDLNIRTLAARALGELRAASASDDLSRVLANDRSEMARIAAAQALGRIGSVNGAPALVDAMSDTSPYVRMHAVKALGEVGATDAVPVLVHALRDSSWKVRVWAADALALLGATETLDDVARQRRRERRLRARRLMKRALQCLRDEG